MENQANVECGRPLVRPATRGDMWTYFDKQPDGLRVLRVEKKLDMVYFLNKQVIEVHRPVTRTFTKWWGLRKKTVSFHEIEEGYYFRPFKMNLEDEYFFFESYGECVRLVDLPDSTRFIPTDRFMRFKQKEEQKKKSWFFRLLPSFKPQSIILPV